MAIIIGILTLALLGGASYVLLIRGRTRCESCGRLKKLSNRRLCSDCMLDLRRKEKTRIDEIRSLISDIEKADNVELIIARTNRLIEQLRYFKKFDRRGINLLEKPADELMGIYSMKKDEFILKSIKDKVRSSMEALEEGREPRVIMHLMNEAILHIAETKRYLNHARDAVDPLEQTIKNAIIKAQVKINLQLAEEFEARGMEEKALVQYSRTLMYIRENDKQRIMKRELKNIATKLSQRKAS